MTWVTTSDAGRFLAQADSFLVADPVANNALLTEARFWVRLSDPAPGARFGWWVHEGEARGAFVEIPDHVTVCSPLTADSIAGLAGELAHASRVAVDARDAAAVAEAWRSHGRVLLPIAGGRCSVSMTSGPGLATGSPRVADAGDLPLLRAWFALFRERYPNDPSHVEFVVDHPLHEGGIILWEVAATPWRWPRARPRWRA